MADALLSVVVLAYLDQPLLRDAVHAVLDSEDISVEVLVVDNGCTTDTVEQLGRTDRVRVISPGRNLGFAAGCNLGARHARGTHIAFVNGDVLVEPPALARLAAAVDEPDIGLATASVRLMTRPEVINTAGNPIHFTGLSWAGGMGRPATAYAEARDVASASGATCVMGLDRFTELAGFCETLFTYVEDAELSLRVWQRGWRVIYVPDAVVRHDYEFSRNPGKYYLLERNRLFMVLTLFGPRLLVAVAPVLVALEVAVLSLAARDGWAREKVRGWCWLVRNAGVVARRRRLVQAARREPDARLAEVLTSTFDPGVEGFNIPPLAQRMLDRWWRSVLRLL